MPHNQDSNALIRALFEHRVRFVMIGGLAAILQGSPFPTEDLDITPERSIENLKRLSEALTAIDARIFTSSEPDGLPFNHSPQSLGQSGVWNLLTIHGRLDISFVPSGTEGFADLSRDAQEISILGIQVRVADLGDIIRSKQAANRPKDQRVLPTLREIYASRHAKNQSER